MSQKFINLNIRTFKLCSMDWETKLIKTYFLVSEYFWVFDVFNERFSNNNTPKFTDIEAATIYIYCTIDDFSLEEKKEIYTYADRHLRSWFPTLPKYEAFSYRINQLSECFRYLAMFINKDYISQHVDFQNDITEFLGDSMPIMMAKGSRSFSAKVAPEIAAQGYCATKKMYYHGLKLHSLNVMASEAKLPHPKFSALSSAAVQDYEVFKNDLLPLLKNSKCYLDSAYFDEANKAYYLEEFNVTIHAIAKKKRGQKTLFADQSYQNTAISKVRQPIESFFNWLIQKTSIQNASKTRATKGVLSHVYGKIAAASVFLAIFNF
jgi:hypothetical protein